jgi:hypothetical protein
VLSLKSDAKVGVFQISSKYFRDFF